MKAKRKIKLNIKQVEIKKRQKNDNIGEFVYSSRVKVE